MMASNADGFWANQFRTMRHSPCLMRPLTALLLITVTVLSFLIMIFQFPGLVLGFLLSPLTSRFQWIIEFLYPLSAGRWVHLFMVRLGMKSRFSHKEGDKNRGSHSRTVETRVEVIKGRVYLHPLPQLLDNLGYLVVCCPESETNQAGSSTTNTKLGKVVVRQKDPRLKIVAFVVDCGDATAVALHVKMISEIHYQKRPIVIQSILSTHKHHDHTAGNRALRNHKDLGSDIRVVFGGAVERVPECNFLLADGDRLPLPKDGENDMNELVEVEAIATPAHTRGSLTYALRPKAPDTSSASVLLFTGDTMFCGGGGVPFEADMAKNQEAAEAKMTASSFLNVSASMHAVERCFAEILFRCVPHNMMETTSSDSVLVFPGHEYTQDLIARQLGGGSNGESCRWKNFSPGVFFETVSYMYTALHRRSLPSTSGRLLAATSTMRLQVSINPHFRMLKKRGETLIGAMKFWHKHFAKTKISSDLEGAFGWNGTLAESSNCVQKTASTDNSWVLDANDLNRPVFTTVYASDLDRVIAALEAGAVDPLVAARKLRELKHRLDKPVVGRRPLPGSLPSERLVFRGLLSFALLGSSPTALTQPDSQLMKLPAPINKSSDRIRVCKKRLVAVLYWLGLLADEDDGQEIVAIIDQLWKEAFDYGSPMSRKMVAKYGASDVESSPDRGDYVELGWLKWVAYGIPTNRPTWCPPFCMPCSKPALAVPTEKHPAVKSGMERQSGELVRHDVLTCQLCRSMTGCPASDLVELNAGKKLFIKTQQKETKVEDPEVPAEDESVESEESEVEEPKLVPIITSTGDGDAQIEITPQELGYI